MKKDRYFLYARKSTDDEDHQILSIEAQLAEVREYAKKQSIPIAKEFLEAKSAKVPGRPVFNAMIEEIETGGVNGLLAWHPDRLARNSIDGGRIIYLLDTNKLKSLKFPTLWFDNTPQGKFMLNIAFGQSKYYVDNLSENVLRGFRQKVRRGEWPGKAPVGYLNEPKLRTIVVDPDRSELVVRLFEEYATGRYNMHQIHQRATIWGLTNVHNKPVSIAIIRGLLINPLYAGSFFLWGEMHEGSHKALVSWDLFDRVQAIIRRQWRRNQSGGCRPGDRSDFPFIGLMRCGECGASITAERHKGHNYYHCTHGRGPCSQRHFLREEACLAQLRPIIESVALTDEWREQMHSCIEETRRQEHESISMLIKQTQDQIEAVQKKLDRLMELYLESAVTHEEFNEYKQKWIPQKQDLQGRLVSYQNHKNPPLDALEETINTANEAGRIARTDNPREMRTLLRKIGAVVTLMPGSIVQVEYIKSWRILSARSQVASWMEVYEALKTETGLPPEPIVHNRRRATPARDSSPSEISP